MVLLLRSHLARTGVLVAAIALWPAVAGSQDRVTSPSTLSPELLRESLSRGHSFLLQSQREAGDFRYHVNFLTGQTAPEQNAVRQAGALWGLALLHREYRTEDSRKAIQRGIAFFARHSALTGSGGRFLRFPGTTEGDSGAVALVTLAQLEFLAVEPPDSSAELRRQLTEYVVFLKSLQRSDYCFYRQYLLSSGEGWGQPSPYFDGEILLALSRAAALLNDSDLVSDSLRSADAMFERYTRRPTTEQVDDDDAKGFFQWGCLACSELFELDRENPRQHAERAIRLSHWMIDVHKISQRRRNTAYALEGILAAWQLANQIGDETSARQFRAVIEHDLKRLTTWQVGGPIPCAYLQQIASFDPSCIGGVLSADQNPWLRIDVTQHQMHAVILALRHLFGVDQGKSVRRS